MLLKIKKIIKYIQLYGISRTYEKILTHIHSRYNFKFYKIKSDFKANENNPVALIGCGNFAFSTIGFFLSKKNKNFLNLNYDLDQNKSISLSNFFGGKFTNNVQDIYNNDQIKLVYISSNHASHAPYAIECIKNDKYVHIEKPHVVNFEQLKSLSSIMKEKSNVKVFLGFNRPFSDLTVKIKKELDKEQGNTISNFFILGHKLSKDHWYYKINEGSRVISNLCHWTDLLLNLIDYEDLFPIEIIPCSPASNDNFSVSIIFNNKSFSNLIFSSEAEAFEGVRESINIQKGNLYAKILDYKYLEISRGHETIKINKKIKDQGHKLSILNSYLSTLNSSPYNLSRKYIILTGFFYLKIDQSLKLNQKMIIKEEDFLKFYN